jgi:CubicO group peptidase (beta-lactamase class C family)
MPKRLKLALSLAFVAGMANPASSGNLKSKLDMNVPQLMEETGTQGLAVAVIENGRVRHTQTWGLRNAQGGPLTTSTVMYGASLTKAVFAYTVMQLVEEGRIDLDTSIANYLAKPLPDYPEEDKYSSWQDLAGDERWRMLTPRILLNHGSGFANFGFLEPDQKLRFHFTPGSRYAYSGDGIILLQFVLERGLGLDVGDEMQRRVFDRFGMADTSMMWRPDFASNLADGWHADGSTEPHDERSTVRAAGSMDTTIADFAKFSAAFMKGEGLTRRGRAEMIRPQLRITTASQFPSLQPEASPESQFNNLASGLGVVTFDGPQGRGFFKGGHNDSTGNMWVCLEKGRRCVVLMANDVRAEAAFPRITKLILGETSLPWIWEYGPEPWAIAATAGR